VIGERQDTSVYEPARGELLQEKNHPPLGTFSNFFCVGEKRGELLQEENQPPPGNEVRATLFYPEEKSCLLDPSGRLGVTQKSFYNVMQRASRSGPQRDGFGRRGKPRGANGMTPRGEDYVRSD
jgi:hypothetical protein